MSIQVLPIHRTTNNNNNNGQLEFDAFNFISGQDQNIRWLSRPNQQIVREKYGPGTQKFRITFDAENFQPEQIKIYIQNHKLTITGVYEERTEGRFMQKQFEKAFDIPNNADVEVMASYITSNHMLVTEIPLNPNHQQQQPQQQQQQQPSSPTNLLNVNNNLNDQRRLSFSLNKFNTLNNPSLLSTTNNNSSLPPPGQQVRRTSVSKVTTTTTSTGSSGLSPEVSELLRNADSKASGTQTYTTQITEGRPSYPPNQQIIINEPPVTKTTTLTNADLANLPIEIPPELLATGGTITIQKRKISVTKTADPNAILAFAAAANNANLQSNNNDRR